MVVNPKGQPVRDDAARERRSRLGWWLFQLAISTAVLAIGATGATSIEIVVGLLSVACILIFWELESFRPRRSATLVLLVAALLTTLTLVQCCPLPAAWVTVLSPHTADIWQRALLPLREQGPRMVTLSIDPAATKVEVLRGIAYSIVFVCVIASRRKHEVVIQRLLIGLGALVITIAAIHYAFDLKKVYGLYTPRTAVTTIAPLLNSNQLCAFGNVAMVLAYSAVVGNIRLSHPALMLTVIVACAAADVFWASRAAVASAVVGLGVVSALALRARVPELRRLALPVVLTIGAVGLVILAVTPASSHLADRDVSKLKVALQVVRELVPRYWFFGTGRGAFESAFPEVREGVGFVVWTHPENVIAEWTSGWGVPAAVVAIIALSYALRPSVVATNRAIGPWVALVVVGLHNLVDFSLEIPAMAIAAAACAGLVLRGRTASRAPLKYLDKPRRIATIAALVAVGGISLGASRGSDLLDDRMRAERVLREHKDFVEAEPLLRSMMAAHPAEPYFPYVGAVVMSRTTNGNVLPWVERTLERAPVYPPAHAVLARWFRHRSPAQARLEYRLFAEQMEDGSVVSASDVESLVSNFDDALELAPRGALGTTTLNALAVRIAARLPASAVRLDEEILARTPAASEPILRAAAASLRDLSEPWCNDPQPCVRRSLTLASRVEAVRPRACDGFIVEASALAHDQPRAALQCLRLASMRVDDRAPCDEARARVALAISAEGEAQEAIGSLSNAPCTGTQCVDNLIRAAELEKLSGSGNRSLVYLRRAVRAAPDDDLLIERVAQAASSQGFHTEAGSYYRDLVSRHPDDQHLSQGLSNEEAAVAVERSRERPMRQ